MIKEHPILMQGWGVLATLDDRKTQTRRVMKHQPVGSFIELTNDLGYPASRGNIWAGFGDPEDPIYYKCPYGQPGDLLYCKETWCRFPCNAPDGMGENVYYKAHYGNENSLSQEIMARNKVKWRPSIYMPKWAARLWLRITDIRVERVQDISTGDAEAEGCWRTPKTASHYSVVPPEFEDVWDSIHVKPKLSKRNPWTRALEKCYVSYPWEDIQVARQHRGLTWYVTGNCFVWVLTSERVLGVGSGV